jgi:ABC-type transport system involved in cytochrome bd biosynthesis fused ATPase/permease subunit
MDPVVIAAIAMLAVWGVATVFFEAPGWVHLLLTVGLFLLLWRIVTRKAARPKHE